MHNPLSRASSIRRMSTMDGVDEVQVNGMAQGKQDNKSIINMDEGYQFLLLLKHENKIDLGSVKRPF